MDTEFEAKFENVDKRQIRKRLKALGAKLVSKQFLQTRTAFSLPQGNEISGGWIRVRKEAERVTLSLKVINGEKICDQKETVLTVDSYDEAAKLLTMIGCRPKGMQENLREFWVLNGAEIYIDEWPFLNPFVEVEAQSENDVKRASELLGFCWEDALYGPVSLLVERQYGVPQSYVNNEAPDITFGGNNPWVEWRANNKQLRNA